MRRPRRERAIPIALWSPHEDNPWHCLAGEIAVALYGPCRREVRLSNNKRADIVPWVACPLLDKKRRVRYTVRIIEAKLSHRRSWKDVNHKYRRFCRWLEIWCLDTARLRRGEHLRPPPGVIVRGPYELLQMLLSKDRSGKRFSANYERRRALAKRLWSLKWAGHLAVSDLTVFPLRFLLRN